MRPFLLVFIVLSICYSAENVITIKEVSGSSCVNYPIQIGRPFMPGQISDFPQVVIDGTPIVTQADVKIRYSDNSVRHAVICFLIPSLPANGTITITFQNQLNGNLSDYLSKTNMLSSAYNFDALIELTNGITDTISARTMLNNNSFTYWFRGSVATSIILADHSEARIYDVGSDDNRSFRPIFHATFWPVINKVYVRFIGEISNTEVWQDQSFSVILKAGQNSLTTVHSQSNVIHYAGSRWTKKAWIGGTPSAVDIDHNVAYIAKTRFAFNYDTTKQVSQSYINSKYSSWIDKSKDFYELGDLVYRDMGTGGGRPAIGPMPGWIAQWLFSGDHRMAEISFINADMFGAYPMHFREGNASKKILRTGSVAGLGHVMSLSNRPTLALAAGIEYKYTDAEDKVNVVGTYTNGGWIPDNAHQPDPYSMPYTLTGEFWYLEQLYFWAGYGAARPNGAAFSYHYGRGPTGAEGGISGQIRGLAWSFRNRCHAAFLAPDNAIEKEYFKQLIDDAIAVMEGHHNITTTAFYQNACWRWGYDKKYPSVGLPPLNQWRKGSSTFAQTNYGIDPAVTLEAISNFEQHYLMVCLGRAKELGFATDALVSYLAVNYVNQVTNPDFNPYVISNGRLPTVKQSGEYFQSWAEMLTGYNIEWQTKTEFNLNSPEGYPMLALAAVSMIEHEPGGDSAWAFMKREVLPAPVLDDNPWWALKPRDSSSITEIKSLSALSGDGEIAVFLAPFNSTAFLRYKIPFKAKVKLSVYTVNGRFVSLLEEGMKSPGMHSVCLNVSKNEVSGVFFYRLEVAVKNREIMTLTKKMIMIK